jgi:hypothetical protein
MEAVNREAEARILKHIGIDELKAESDELQKEIDKLERKQRKLRDKIHDRYEAYCEENDLNAGYYTTQSATDHAKEATRQEVLDEMGVGDIVREAEAMEAEINDAIMLATSPTRLKEFVHKVMDKFGIEATEGGPLAIFSEEE